ncbi:hypothetical protein V8G54_036699 [Vigna mungo]|uniref:Uncharacterized protein n=1 Tax=Vigna mungo TaxID=3915 RepID=A0AAQ3MHU5_VIGMU
MIALPPPLWSRTSSRSVRSVYVINAPAMVRYLAPRCFMAAITFAKETTSSTASSSVHQFGGDWLGKFASLQALELSTSTKRSTRLTSAAKGRICWQDLRTATALWRVETPT